MAAVAGGGGCGGVAWPKGEEREREHVQKFLWGSFNVPYFALLFYLADAVRFKFNDLSRTTTVV